MNLKTETHLAPVLGHGHHLNSSHAASTFPSSSAFVGPLHSQHRTFTELAPGPVVLVGCFWSQLPKPPTK